MIQQAARYLMKNVKAVWRGSEPKYPLEYLKDLKNVEKRTGMALSYHDYLRIEVIEDALATRSNLMVGSTMLKLAQKKNLGKSVLHNDMYSQEMLLMT